MSYAHTKTGAIGILGLQAGEDVNTVQQSTSFLGQLSRQPALMVARVVRAGKTLAFGEIDIAGERGGKSACRASTAYALL